MCHTADSTTPIGDPRVPVPLQGVPVTRPVYQQCKHSLFISYAHLDDRANNGWVTTLKEALFDRLVGMLPSGIPKFGIHFSGQKAILSGDLASQLRSAVDESFAMLIVVGKQYVGSGWCEVELEAFQNVFGADPEGGRLFVAVMGEDLIASVSGLSRWKQVVGGNACIEMFDPVSRNDPLEPRMEDGSPGLRPPFKRKAYAIADRLIEEITKDFNATERQALIPSIENRPPLKGSWATHSAEPLRVLIGPCTQSLDAQSDRIQATLKKAGLQVSRMQREDLVDYDADDPSAVRAVLDGADVLVVPLGLEKPLLPSEAGGHATILQREWKALGKRRDVVWYRPPIDTGSAQSTLAAKHLAVFDALAPVCTTEPALVNLLIGAGEGSAIKLYIEENPRQQHEAVIRELNSAWNRARNGQQRPDLAWVTLKLRDLPTTPNDAAGVVLLYADRNKSKRSLSSQEAEVEKLLPKPLGKYPGLVAAISPPVGAVPDHRWRDATFLSPGDGDTLTVDPVSDERVARFLEDAWRHHEEARTGHKPPSPPNGLEMQ